MQPKILSKRALLIAAPVGFILFASLFLYFIPERVVLVERNAIASDEEQTIDALPSRLKIPSIKVDAPIGYVGLTPDGAMDVPKDPVSVVWFNLGQRPGENGSAVIAGHYGWKDNIPAVFDNLHKLRVGDTVFVEDEEGVAITFVVRETRTYGKDDVVPEVFASSDGKAHLNLVTCTGTWNSAEETFSERLVVFTDKE